jgi:hypothetical protein
MINQETQLQMKGKQNNLNLIPFLVSLIKYNLLPTRNLLRYCCQLDSMRLALLQMNLWLKAWIME